MSTGGLLGGLVGGVVGFFLGGPAGAVIGAGIGMGLGMAVDPMTPDIPSPGQPETAEVSISQSREGEIVKDFLGTTKISVGNYLWYGKERVVEHKEEVETGGSGGGSGGGSSEEHITGYSYYLSWALGIATGQIDKLYAVFKDDDLSWAGNLSRPASGGVETISLVSVELEEVEGGKTIGEADFYFGTDDQEANAVMTAELGTKLNPSYRHLCYCFFDDCFIGDFNRAPTMKFVVGKYPVFAFNSQEIISTYDYNPAHAIWYIMTEMVGLSESFLSSTSFSDVADTLYSEGRGVSINFNRQQDSSTYIESILNHIDGMLRYENDGKFHLKLNRNDIAVGSLPTVSKDDMLDDLQINRKSWIDTLNDIKVQYIKRTGEADEALSGSSKIGTGYPGYGVQGRTLVRTSDGVLHSVHYYNSAGQYAKSEDGGKTWTVSSIGGTGLYGIYVDGSDNLYVSNDVSSKVYVRKYDASTSSWGSWLYLGAGPYQYRGKVVVDSNGLPYFLCMISPPGYGTYIAGMSGIDPAKTPIQLGTILSINDFEASFDSSNVLHIITNAKYGAKASGRIVHISGTIRANPFPPPDFIWTTIDEENITADSAKTHIMPSIAIDGDEKIHALWAQNEEGQAAHYVPAYSGKALLGPWSAIKKLRAEDQAIGLYPGTHISHTSDGRIHVVYANGQQSDTWIRYVCSADGGLSFSNEISIITGTHIRSPYLLYQKYPATMVASTGISLIHRKFYSPDDYASFYGGAVYSSGSFLDFEEAEINIRDIANQELVGKVNHKTIKMGMFAVPANVAWSADQFLKRAAYPLASYSFPANRNVFRWDPGDAFILNYTPYSISGKVCRVVVLTEDDAESEVITVNALEDIHYLATETNFTAVEGDPDIRDVSVDALVTTDVFGAPYVLVGEAREIISVAARETGTELGYQLFMSIDGGTSYSRIGIVKQYTFYGTLDDEYLSSTYQIDDEFGFQITFSAESQITAIETTTREHLLTGKYIALLGDELLSFQTITPVSGTTYKIENIFRGRFDTEKVTHAAASPFWLLGLSFFGILAHADLLVGESRKFKMVPYNSMSSGSLSAAVVVDHTITGRALTPYRPDNLAADGKGIRPTYTGGDDIVLTWRARIRGADWADFECNAPSTWEGYFEVEVWVATVLVRTTSGINAVTWTYTNTMNVADNGAAASSIEFRIKNFTDVTGRRYSSTQDTLVVTKE